MTVKTALQKLFGPILTLVETKDSAVNYKKSHRVVLNVVGVMFLILAGSAAWAASFSDDVGYYIPVVIFFGFGSVSLIVGTLGSDAAVSGIWGNK